jgi:hypothetical protein
MVVMGVGVGSGPGPIKPKLHANAAITKSSKGIQMRSRTLIVSPPRTGASNPPADRSWIRLVVIWQAPTSTRNKWRVYRQF